MDLKDDPLIKEYIQNHNIKPNTILRFTRGITLYSEFLDKTPEEWISEAEAEEENRIRMRRRKIKKYLLDFKDYLDSQHFSVLSVKTHMGSVRSMYHEQDIEVPRIILKRDTRQELRDAIPTKENIRFAITMANPKYKAIIYLMTSSGMGMSEVISLSVGDFVKSLQDDIKMSKVNMFNIGELIEIVEEKRLKNPLMIPTWHIIRIKTEMPYVTFSSPESLTAILDYLKTDPPKTLEDPLFRTGVNPTRHQTFCFYFQRLNNKCNFGKPDLQSFFRSHALRKYFATTISEHITKLKVDRLLGHRVDNQTNSYFKTNLPELKEAYIKAIPFISIGDTEIRVLESEDKKLLTKLKVELESQSENSRLQAEQIAALQRQLDRKDEIEMLKPKED